jgi:hypothetical protein
MHNSIQRQEEMKTITGITIYLSSGCKTAIDGLGGKELKLFLVSKLVLSSYLAMKFAKNYII